MSKSALAEIYFMVAMMVLILIICAAAVFFFFRQYKREKMNQSRTGKKNISKEKYVEK